MTGGQAATGTGSVSTAGLITWRPIDDDTEVRLLLVRDGAGRVLGKLQTMFATQARRHTERAR